MVLEYFNYRRWKKENPKEAEEHLKSPVLNEEDEKLLQRITSQGDQPAALPDQPTVILDNGEKLEGKEAQEALEKEGAKEAGESTDVPAEDKEESKATEESKAGEEVKLSEETKPADVDQPVEEAKPSEEGKPAGESKAAEESKPSEEAKPSDAGKTEEEKKKQSYWSYLPAIPSYHFTVRASDLDSAYRSILILATA